MLLVLFVNGVSADSMTDTTNDIYHHTWVNEGEFWTEYAEEKENIDITSITYSISGGTLSVTMQVVGEFQSSPKHVYSFIYNSTDGIYTFSYVAGTGMAAAVGTGDGFDMKTGTVTVSGNTLSGSIETFGAGEELSALGVAAEYLADYDTITDPTSIEYYADYAPGTLAPWFGGDTMDDTTDDTADDVTDDTTDDTTEGDESTGGSGTPGFELLTIVAAIGVALILLRKKK